MNNIMMNIEMTKAILCGRKVQTRRAIKVDTVMYNNPEILDPDSCVKFHFSAGGCQNHSSTPLFINSKYQIGDIVWVREPAKIDMCFTEEIHFHYLADNTTSKLNIPKRFVKDGFVANWMAHCNGVPNGCVKEMARIFLKITDVRVERLQDMKHEDILSEGFPIESYEMKDTSKLYSNDTHGEIDFEEDRVSEWLKIIWNKTAPKGYKWDDNPYVFVYEFKRVNKNGSKL